VHDEGGEAVCWLDMVCDRCGALIDDAAEHRCRPSIAARASVARMPQGSRHQTKPDPGEEGPAPTLHDMERRDPYEEKLSKKRYESELRLLQIELVKVQRWVVDTGARIVILFDGRDAAGTSGSILRFTEHLDPRAARVVALPAPNETERGQWYFQRYVQHLPTTGEIVLFDRSWYDRAGVEHVLGSCTPQEYREFLRQAPGLERSLVQSGIRVFKLWFTLSADEQRKRLAPRPKDPLRQWKLSPVDVDRYDDFGAARDAMLHHTDHPDAPWTVINANDERRARLEAIRAVLSSVPYADRDDAVAHAPDPAVVQIAR